MSSGGTPPQTNKLNRVWMCANDKDCLIYGGARWLVDT
jgi:hypothetical protein